MFGIEEDLGIIIKMYLGIGAKFSSRTGESMLAMLLVHVTIHSDDSLNHD